MKPLFLILKTRWFREIEAGTKTIEYRDATPFWKTRLAAYIRSLTRSERPSVIFQLGYNKGAERITATITAIDLKRGKYEISLANVKKAG